MLQFYRPQLIKPLLSWCLISSLFFFQSAIAATMSIDSKNAIAGKKSIDRHNNEANGSLVSEREKVDLVDDSTVAEAIDRRPDLNFRNITIDGEKAQVSLDELPAEAVSNTEVLRANTPDLNAESRGGSLSIQSSPTFNLKTPVTKGEIYYGYNEEGGKDRFGGNITHGKSLGNIGFRVGFKASKNSWYDESTRMDWKEIEYNNENYFVPKHHFLMNWTGTDEKFSANANIDFKISDIFSLYTRGSFDRRDLHIQSARLRHRLSDGDYIPSGQSQGISQNATMERDVMDFEAEDRDNFLQFGGLANWPSTRLDFQVSQDSSNYVEPSWFIIEFRQEDIDIAYSLAEPRFPDFSTDVNRATDTDLYQFEELVNEYWSDKKSDLIATINLKHDFSFTSIDAFFKTGLRIRSREKDQISQSNFFAPPESADFNFTLSDVLGNTFRTSEADSKYNFGPTASPLSSREYFAENRSNFLLNERRTREKSDPATFDVSEDVSAAYLMFNLERGRLRSLIGARVEQTDLEYLGRQVEISESGDYLSTQSIPGSTDYRNWFPAFHLRYFLGEKTTLIGAWTKSIKRPWYGDIVPFRKVDYEDTSIDEGNPELKPTLYENIDISLDYKLNDASLFSLELFSRDITDIVYWEENKISGGIYDGFILGSKQNGPSAERQGVKFIWNQDLESWSSTLKGLSFNFNTTYQDSETEYQNHPGKKLPITGTNKRFSQLTLNYDINRLFVQLMLNKNSNVIRSIADDFWRNSYSRAREYAELSTSYKVNKNLRAVLKITNLLNSSNERYLGDTSRPSFYEVAKRKLNLSLKMTL